MKKLLIFGPFCEWNDFVNFNSYLFTIRQHYKEIIAVVPEKAMGIITEADKFITISNKYLDEHKANYPNVLENLGTAPPIQTPNGLMLISNRNQSDFFKKALDYIHNNEEKYIDYELKFYEQEERLYEDPAQNIYTKLFKNLEKWILANNLVYPTEKTFIETEKKFGHLFNDKTYILLTRNFKNKVPQENTHVVVPCLEEIVNHLVQNGLQIVNIGFPPSHFNIFHKNYHEITPSISQEELVCLFYLSRGVLLSGVNGGFTAHISSNADCFLIAPELWSRSILNLSIFDAKMNNKSVSSIDLCEEFRLNNKDKILDVLTKHKTIATRRFIQEKEKVYVA